MFSSKDTVLKKKETLRLYQYSSNVNNPFLPTQPLFNNSECYKMVVGYLTEG